LLNPDIPDRILHKIINPTIYRLLKVTYLIYIYLVKVLGLGLYVFRRVIVQISSETKYKLLDRFAETTFDAGVILHNAKSLH